MNIVAELRDQTRGSGCRPLTGDGAVQTGPKQIRRPAVGLDRGARKPGSMLAAGPRLVVEVLSPSTRDFDTIEKLGEYQSVPGLDYILYVDPNRPEVRLWSRTAVEWSSRPIEGPNAEIDLPRVGVTLSMADVYDEVTFPAVPRLVGEEEPPGRIPGRQPPGTVLAVGERPRSPLVQRTAFFCIGGPP